MNTDGPNSSSELLVEHMRQMSRSAHGTVLRRLSDDQISLDSEKLLFGGGRRPSIKTKDFFNYDYSVGSLDDDIMSMNSSRLSLTGGHGQTEEEQDFARKESKHVHWLRLALFIVLTITASAVSATGFVFTKSNEQHKFETAFWEQATRLIDSFQINAKQRVKVIETFALSITSNAHSSNSTWPFVTIPDFERQGRTVVNLADTMSMIMVPIVTDENRDEWETYSVENQGWFQEGLEVQEVEQSQQSNRRMERRIRKIPNWDESNEIQQTSHRRQAKTNIPEEIYRLKNMKPTRESGPGPYLPRWQIAPVVPVPELVNFNLLSHDGYRDSLTALLDAKVSIVGRSFDFSDPTDEQAANRRDVFDFFLTNYQSSENIYEDDPIADVHVPIFDSYQNNRRMVGLLSSVIYWRTYFVNILPESTSGIVLVLSNTCNQQYTYEINGASVEYVGPGDRHDSRYDFMRVSTGKEAYLQDENTARDVSGSCLYSIHVYPSETLENEYISNKPTIYFVILICIFLFTSGVFVVYDYLVERRQRLVMDTAVASSAIVSSLFPKVVRDRLYHNNPQSNDVHNTELDGQHRQSTNQGRQSTNQAFLNEPKDNDIQDGDIQDFFDDEMEMDDSAPIAELFKDCTVLFADIAGFTSWSSDREPSEVFILLETLYAGFDRIAKRRKVFKVETIGDCYLAVTGLPEPQKDHAVIMSLFAHECMRKMKTLLAEDLRDKLGGDTACLTMRFGLHSGPVTAGVLRGEKSRFQLFGDTVNTASRMESTGSRDRIQVSEATAELLLEAGKGTWLEERKDRVEAKGKGELKTFWIRPRTRASEICKEDMSSLQQQTKSKVSFRRSNSLPMISTNPAKEDEENRSDSTEENHEKDEGSNSNSMSSSRSFEEEDSDDVLSVGSSSCSDVVCIEKSSTGINENGVIKTEAAVDTSKDSTSDDSTAILAAGEEEPVETEGDHEVF